MPPILSQPHGVGYPSQIVALLPDILYLLLGFGLLAWGADRLVSGGVTIAQRTGVSPMVTGLTIVALGTSLPEVVVGGLAAARGEHGLTFGTVLGSNVANIALVLGVTALVLPRTFHERLSVREGSWLLGSLGLVALLLLDLSLTRLDALILLAGFSLYQVLLLRTPGEEGEGALEATEDTGTKRPWLAVIIGSASIAIGAENVMRGGEGIALALGVPNSVVGFTILALGTSLPELAAGVASALKGHAEVGIGNVIGSNVFNVLAVLGISGLVRPTDDSTTEFLTSVLERDLPITAGVSLLLILLLAIGTGRAGRPKAALLVVLYGAWSWWVFRGGAA